MYRFATALLVLPLALSALVLRDVDELELLPPNPAVQITPPALDPTSSSCNECHAEVTAEWASSAHALSWKDEHYQESIKDKRRPTSCHGCHIPTPVLATEELARRPRSRKDVDPHLGVSCESCHLGPEGAMLGLRGTPTDAHPSKSSRFMTAPGSNELCAHCHGTTVGPVVGLAKDFEEEGFSAQGLSCVGCHMAPVTRSFATGAPERTGRSHALQTPRDPAFLRQAFQLDFKADAAGNRVIVSNQAGHRVPGLIGREIRWSVQVLDASGTVLETVKALIDTRVYLPAAGTLDIPLTKQGTSVHITGIHVDPRSESPIPFLDETLEPTN